MSLFPDERARRFADLYERCYGAIYAYAARRVDGGYTDEVAAETFLVAWRKFDSLPSDPLPWLYGVARNVVARHWQEAGRQQQALAALKREPAAGPGHESDDSRLWDAWAQLSEIDREVLALIAWEELSVADAACVLGCTAPVCSVRLHRARRRLQRLLAHDPSCPSMHPVEA